MATRKKSAGDEVTPAAPVAGARALVALPAFGVACGTYFKADAQTLAALVAEGAADAHPDAVAYARSLEAPAQEA